MEIFFLIGALFIVGAIVLALYLLTPPGTESANPIKQLFGRSAFFSEPEEVATQATEQYKLLSGLYQAKTEALEQHTKQFHVVPIEEAKSGAEISGYNYTAAINNAAAQDGLPIDTRAEIALLKAKQTGTQEKEDEAKLERKMFLYKEMVEARREYYRLKADKASKRELDAQKLYWEDLQKEWESISKS